MKRENKVPLRKGLKVLIAEDNEVNMFLSKSIVRQIAPDSLIIEAINGEEAVQKYLESQPDLILMDVQMPEMDGLEATRWIRRHIPEDHQPIVFAMSAGVSELNRSDCLEAGMDGFISKPVNINNLTEALREAVSRIDARTS